MEPYGSKIRGLIKQPAFAPGQSGASKQSIAATTPPNSQPPENSMCETLRSQYSASQNRQAGIRTEIKYNPQTRENAQARLEQEKASQAQLMSQMQSMGCQ